MMKQNFMSRPPWATGSQSVPALFVQNLKMGTRFEDFNGDPGGGLSDGDDDNSDSGDSVDDDYDSWLLQERRNINAAHLEVRSLAKQGDFKICRSHIVQYIIKNWIVVH